jgi:4-amino-4-deoxy-L-arabinose transferase-like glycosyltransferase
VEVRKRHLLPAAVMLLGGLTLAVLGQMLWPLFAPAERGWLIPIVAAGVGSFLLAGQLFTGRQLPSNWLLPGKQLAAYLGLRGSQLLLLVFAPWLALLAWLAAGDQLLMIHAGVGWAAWVLLWLTLILGSWRSGERWQTRISRFDALFLLVVLVVAFLLRGVGLAAWPNTLSGDEGSAGLTALMFLDGRATNPFTVGWFSFPSFYFAVQSLGILLLGQTTEALRITSSLAGALNVVAIYFLGRAFFDRGTGLLAAAYLLTAHFHLHFSRIGLNNIWDSLFITLILAGIAHGWRTGRRSSFILAGFALGWGQYFYVSIRTLPLLLLLWAGLALWRQRTTFQQRLPDLILTAYIALLLVLPLALYFGQHPDEFRAPLQRVTILDGWLEREQQITGQSAGQIVAEQMRRSLLGFTHEPLRLLYDPGTPLLLPAAGALFLLGLLGLIAQPRLPNLLLILPLIAVVVMGGLSQDPPASQRYMPAMPLVALILVYPLRQAWEWLTAVWPGWQPLITTAVITSMALLMVTDVHFYFVQIRPYYVLGGFNTQTATAIADFLQEQTPPNQLIYFAGFPRMGYRSLSTIPYLAPEMRGHDINEPLTAPPAWMIVRPSIAIFLPERLSELQFWEMVAPDGRREDIYLPNGLHLFTAYILD